jgi:hypothetical protein
MKSGNFAPGGLVFPAEFRPLQFIKCFKNLEKFKKNARNDQAETTARERGRTHVTVQTETGGAIPKQAKDQRILYGRRRASATIDPAVNVKSSEMQRVRNS